MASITLCPRCSSHLELPSGLAPTSLVECPICEAGFLLASVAPRAIPKVRLVEHDATENKTTSAPLGIIVDDADVALAKPAPSVDDRLSRLMRSASSWQLPGVQQPEENEAAAADEDEQPSMLDSPTLDLEISDERIIPNDHAPAVKNFGATLDAAYRDADPETADKSSNAADELQLAGSRLDQLLSDLMKPQTVAAAASPAEPTIARTESPAPPTFTEFAAEDDAVEDETIRFEPQRRREWDEEAATEDEEAEETVAYADEESADEDEYATLDLEAARLPRRRASGVRSLVGIVGGGVIGIVGGAYILLWLRPELDLLNMAQWAPSAILPSSAQSSPESNLADQGALPPPAPVGQLDAEDGSAEPALPTTSTIAIAEPSTVSLEQPAEQEPAAVGENELAAAPPAEPATIHEDAAVITASAVEPLNKISQAPVVASPIAEAKHWPTTPIVGQLRAPKFYSLAELDATLPGADAAHRGFLAGDLSRKDDISSMGQAYIELCKLAEQFTLTDPDEYGNELITKQMNAKNIFRGVVGDPARRNDLAMIAGRWLQHAGRSNQGVVILGKVTDLEAQGLWTEYTIETPLGDSSAVSKVLMEGVPFKSGSDVAVVGTIVSDPRKAIDGYAGEAQQVIVSGFAFAPEDFVAPKIGGVSGEAGDLFSLGE
jgi:hypothetical protein